MKKPEYLTGECKTFLELVVSDKKHLYSGDGIAQFYSQPSTKDMIVEPEDPAIVDLPSWTPLFKGEWGLVESALGQILVSNLGSVDDFIREAKKAGIKIEWK